MVAFANALGDLGRIDDELSAYEDAAKLDARDVQAQAGIGWALWESGKSKDAEQPLRNAIKLDPNYAYSYGILGKVPRDLSRREESISIWESLIALEPSNCEGHASLGWALGGVGRHREAIPALKRAVELDPTFPAYHSIGLAHLYLKEYQEALELNPGYPEAWHNLGEAYFATEQFEKAADSFEKVLEFGPGVPETHFMLGLTWIKLGRESEALEQCHVLNALDRSKEQELRDAVRAAMPQAEQR